MKRGRLHFFGVMIIVCMTINANAQQEATLYFMSYVPQSSYLNPAFIPKQKLSIGIPGSSVFVQYGNNGFSYTDFVSKQGGVVTADLDKLYGSLKDKNYIVNATQADLLRVNFRLTPKLFFLINATAKSYSSVMLPKELAGILLKGTTPLVASSSSFALEGESTTYGELGVGAAYQVNPKLSVGGRVKFLTGIVSGSTESARGNIALDNNYSVTLSADANIRTSGIKNIENGKISDYLKNSGLSFDLGGTYRLLKNLTLSASVLDIGSISWQNDLNAYSLDSRKANYTFKGIDLQKVLDGDDNYLTAEGDSLKKHFTFKETTTAGYSTLLPAKAYLGGRYNLKERLSVCALLFTEQYRGRFLPGFSASLQKDFGRWVSTSVSYSVINGIFNNIGGGLSLNLAPVQLYFVGDNLLSAPFSINSIQNFNLRFGLNLIFGAEKPNKKETYNSGSKTKPKTKRR